MATSSIILNCFLFILMLFSVNFPSESFTTSSVSTSSSRNCSSQFDCGVKESCCSHLCVVGDVCVEHSCSEDADCRLWESCCDRVCSEHCIPYHNDDADTFIAAGILGTCVLLCIASMCFYFTRYRRRRPYHRPVVLGNLFAIKATTTKMNCTTQNDTPFQAEKLPEYPPHYVEYMQYNAGVRLKEGEPPPCYDDLLEAVQTPPSPYLWPSGS